MNPEIKAKWVEALRSGKYPQTKHRLQDDGGYCCLGVLCDVVDPGGWGGLVPALGVLADKLVRKHRGQEEKPSAEVLAQAGLDATVVKVDRLIDLNDIFKKSFSEIADYIESNL